jgi:hypothetical protein
MIYGSVLFETLERRVVGAISELRCGYIQEPLRMAEADFLFTEALTLVVRDVLI